MTIKNIYEYTTKEKSIKKQLYANERFHVLYLCMAKGDVLKPHTASTDAFLLIMEGEIIFLMNDNEYHLKKGDSFTFKAGERHAVQSVTDASFLLVK
jgi:quercetin dioxygenase-like cupin family protein